MTVHTGIICGECDRLNPYDQSSCEECGNDLTLLGVEKSVEKTPEIAPVELREFDSGEVATPPSEAAQQEAEEQPMEQARHKVCASCYNPVPTGHKFCGKCGAPADDNVSTEPEYFGEMQVPGKAKLILIKGEGMDGISYHLNSTEHIAGRAQGAILFTEDNWLSPKHANFYYINDNLHVRDEGSVNGIFLCLQGPTNIQSGAVFMAGGQVFRIETVSPFDEGPESDGTYFFSSPRRNSSFKVVEILEGGGEGMIVHSRDDQVTIGRENSDMNFPNDSYISGSHLKVEFINGGLQLVDLGSKNGTYLKIAGEQELVHGDYLFLGRQLLRVEITS
jgi:pSer/pThr/pTyr-binding forkhead associated (FHA) protein/ribosomal protein L40E